MTTSEVIQLISKGAGFTGLSEKQKNWILGVGAKEAGIHIKGLDPIYLFLPDNRVFMIKQCKRLASGGSYVGTRIIQGRYRMELCYHIVFTDTGNTSFVNYTEYERLIRDGYPAEIYYGWVDPQTIINKMQHHE
jgi:hypothetical protein